MPTTEPISVLVAFGAGLASFLSPCVLPMVPVYLGSLVGPDVFEKGSGTRRLRIFLHSLTFVMGFSIIFSLWGAGVGFLGSVLANYSSTIRMFAGGLLIVMGLFMLASWKIPWLNFEKRLNPSLGTTGGYLRSLLTGGVFSIAWTPCAGPILGSILTLSLNSATATQGAALMAVYSLGLGLPFLVFGLTFEFIAPLLKRINRYSYLIYIISGLLLIAIGVLILTDNLTLFSSLTV